MSYLAKLKSVLTGRRPAARHPAPAAGAALRVDQLPPFSLHVADLMRFDPQVRIGLGARNGLMMAARASVRGDDPPIVRWVQMQWDRLWAAAAHQLLRAKLYGFLPFEVVFRRVARGEFAGALEPERLLDRHPREARILLAAGQPVGFTLRGEPGPPTRHLAPAALVCTFDAEFGNPYGVSLLERAYPPWFEKWMEGGAKKTLRLRMIKDAYLGDIFWYPVDRTVQLPSGETVSWRDVAREMLEARLSGGAMTLPLMYDRDGRKLMDYTPPQDLGGATQIFEWKRDVDLEIWKALEVPPEVIEAARTGSGFSGRSIPLYVALAAAQLELAELVRCVDRDLLRPLVHLNFGRPGEYEILPRPLVETFFETAPAG